MRKSFIIFLIIMFCFPVYGYCRGSRANKAGGKSLAASIKSDFARVRVKPVYFLIQGRGKRVNSNSSFGIKGKVIK